MNEKNKKYWFKRRRYGYGWIPATWEGWVVTLLFLVLTVAIATITEEKVGLFIVSFLPLLATFLLIANNTGPSPKWRWGSKPDDNPEEDF